MTMKKLAMKFKAAKPSKYRAVKVKTGEQVFASKFEAKVWQMLRLRELAKEIVIEKVQDKILLTDAEIEYRPDFKIRDLKTGAVYWVEAKGLETPEWRLKRRLWAFYGPGRLEIWKNVGPFECSEVIESGKPLPKRKRKTK